MAGSLAGGAKARDTNLKKYGKDFYRNIGRIGGSRPTTGGFAANTELAREAGKLGGFRSRPYTNMNINGWKIEKIGILTRGVKYYKIIKGDKTIEFPPRTSKKIVDKYCKEN